MLSETDASPANEDYDEVDETTDMLRLMPESKAHSINAVNAVTHQQDHKRYSQSCPIEVPDSSRLVSGPPHTVCVICNFVLPMIIRTEPLMGLPMSDEVSPKVV
jgi:hypothetical protein